MNIKTYSMPKDDKWIFDNLLSMIANRLANNGDESPTTRRSLLRLLFAIQRFPMLTDSIRISICIGNYQIVISTEEFGLHVYTEDWHTKFRVQYFEESHHCIDWFDILTGVERKEAISLHLGYLSDIMNDNLEISVEDYSSNNQIDLPLIHPAL